MPAEAIDFGGAQDLSPSLAVTRGRTALLEAVIRRLTTQGGSLPDFPDYGFDLTSLIGTAFSAESVQQQVAAQILLEEEVEYVVVTAQLLSDNITLQLDVTIQDGDGPFDLSISVDDVEVSYVIG